MHKFSVVPGTRRIAATGDILVQTFGNASLFFPISVLADQSITLPPIGNLSSFFPMQLTTGADVDILLPALGSSTGIVAPTVQLSPADGDVRLPALASATSIVAPTVQLSPPDGDVRLPALVNAEAFPAIGASTTAGASQAAVDFNFVISSYVPPSGNAANFNFV